MVGHGGCGICGYWQVRAVQTPAAVPEAEVKVKSMNSPVVMVTEPVAMQLPLVAGEQKRAVFWSVVGVAPARSVTLMAPDCWE